MSRSDNRIYSEATLKVFERTLQLLEKKLDKSTRDGLSVLLRQGRIEDVAAIEALLTEACGGTDR
jgi:hypothetical protein